MRSFPVERRPSVVELATGDALDACSHIEESINRELGASVHVQVDGDCLILPPPFEVRRAGRTLRGEEYEAHAQACLAARAPLAVRAIRFFIEVMYVFDWDTFDERCWRSLDAAFESLSEWQGTQDLPRWFGRVLWASVEPPGLQVAGVLEESQFDRWHRRFAERTGDLPARLDGST